MYKKESGVSPVIAVMLMLVVTIIIAAVVSGFAGSLANANSAKAPSLNLDVKISNSGSYMGSGFSAAVTGVSEPIRTKDLKLITQWKTTSGVSGGNTSIGGTNNFDCYVGMGTNAEYTTSVAPYGFGQGVNSSYTQNPTKPYTVYGQQFGNYTLIPGTTMSAVPAPYNSGVAIGGNAGATSGYGIDAASAFTYTSGTNYADTYTDATQAVLGNKWNELRAGDTVSVSVVHIPSGKAIFSKSVVVTEGSV
ncbi:MAG: type IV pilin N-terminal domain-containing protein [Methanospirillum sp.]|uniref:type IV pilin N-terminal domain-containing protein n=1 Tax=Methanospirillum sp. TaxID=45200 RepID=UPI002374BE02|nr:type IV pilin N-terminal domain-containing protein [Methanospirillum sp.]MDD1729797.1 type IV pilin N-terminal domain-containing protein [Methanospirillum sp.]